MEMFCLKAQKNFERLSGESDYSCFGLFKMYYTRKELYSFSGHYK